MVGSRGANGLGVRLRDDMRTQVFLLHRLWTYFASAL